MVVLDRLIGMKVEKELQRVRIRQHIKQDLILLKDIVSVDIVEEPLTRTLIDLYTLHLLKLT